MDLRELRTVVAVIEEGRFAGVAQRMNLSQPAISHTIRSLEKQCGVKLLERTSAGVVMTTAASCCSPKPVRCSLRMSRRSPRCQAVAMNTSRCGLAFPSGRESESCWSRIPRPSALAEVYEETRNGVHKTVFGSLLHVPFMGMWSWWGDSVYMSGAFKAYRHLPDGGVSIYRMVESGAASPDLHPCDACSALVRVTRRNRPIMRFGTSASTDTRFTIEIDDKC
jgi:Bacterial regulatory helix-turn-helix protein, lysR family